MLDSYTSNMCLRSWGRNAYARALIDVSGEKQLMEEIVITVPYGKEKGHSLATIKLEYDRKPPRCDTCKIFDHTCDQCPKNMMVNMAPQTAVQDDFIEVKRKHNKGKAQPKTRHIAGIKMSKPPVSYYYRKVEKGETSSSITRIK
ncbi:hypothetical protein Tco_1249939 [Tanacetum coccineum]